jgi:hypothetical protein
LRFEIGIGCNFELRIGDLGEEDCCLSLSVGALVFLLWSVTELVINSVPLGINATDTSIMDTGHVWMEV